jgi:predicted transport protein
VSDIKLFRITAGTASEVKGAASGLEKPLQAFIERNLESLLGVTYLATEYSTGKTHAGRIDTLGIDENNCPVILEYKRSIGENVINQGLFYLDWLMDHKAEFQLLVMKQLGATKAESIAWSGPRLICIAADFTKYDSHAVLQMNRNIELIRYRQFDTDLLLLEVVNSAAATTSAKTSEPASVVRSPAKSPARQSGTDKTVADWLASLSPELRATFDTLEGFVMSLGDDVQRKDLKVYVAFKRLRNFATVAFTNSKLYLMLHLDPATVVLETGFSRDVSNIGHFGTGDLELSIGSIEDLERAKPLIQRAYEG